MIMRRSPALKGVATISARMNDGQPAVKPCDRQPVTGEHLILGSSAILTRLAKSFSDGGAD
jgi:hypothetical protein